MAEREARAESAETRALAAHKDLSSAHELIAKERCEAKYRYRYSYIYLEIERWASGGAESADTCTLAAHRDLSCA